MRRLRIGFLNPAARFGGAEIALLDMMASLRKSEPDWALSLILASQGPVSDRARDLGVDVQLLEFPPAMSRVGDSASGGPAGSTVGRLSLAWALLQAVITLPSYAFRLGKAIRALEADLLHTNGFKMHVLAALTAPRGTPLVWHIHDFVQSRPIMARLLRILRGRCSAVITNSLSVAEDVQALLGPRAFVKPILNGIDLQRFTPEGEGLDLDRLSGMTAEKDLVRVGLMATMARWKGQEVFLRAFALLKNRNVRGYVIGGALYETVGSQYTVDELKALRSQLGLDSVVGFTGFVEEPEKALRSLDVVVHASISPEPFGLVIAEALATARPVIVADAGGAGEIRRLAKGVRSYTPGDAVRLAEIIDELSGDPALRSELGRAGRVSAETLFDRDRLAAQISSVYAKVIPR